jgi:hypothetical protein
MSPRHLKRPDVTRWLSWLAWGSLGLTVVMLFALWPLLDLEVLLVFDEGAGHPVSSNRVIILFTSVGNEADRVESA